MFLLVDFIERFDVGFIKFKNNPNRQHRQQDANRAKKRRKIEHRRKRKNELRQRVEIHKTTFKKRFQRLIRLGEVCFFVCGDVVLFAAFWRNWYLIGGVDDLGYF